MNIKIKKNWLLNLILKNRWLIFLNIYLISPLLYSLGITQNLEGIYDPVILWNFSVSLLFLVWLQLTFKKQLYVHLFIFPIYILVLVDIFLILEFNTRLSAGFIWIVLSNLSESNEFIEFYWKQIFFCFLAFFIFYITSLFKIKNVNNSLSGWKFSLLSTSLIFIAYGSVFVKQYISKKNIYAATMDVVEHDYSIPFGIVSQGAVVYTTLSEKNISLTKRKKFVFNAKKIDDIQKPEVYVLVIGESSRKNNWSLYGYSRNTNPKLSSTNNILTFKDVVTEWPLTQKSIPLILSRVTVSNIASILDEKSLISAFKETGFKTFWLTAQPFDRFAGNINVLSDEANVTKYFARNFDHHLLKPLKDALKTNKDKNKKLLLVVHTKGSHIQYSYRYPKEFEVYSNDKSLSYKHRLINTYDNTILYTDNFLANVIQILKQENLISAMYYISDHGENLIDDERKLLGHNYSNEYDIPIPMLFWYSNEYKENYPLKILNAEKNANKKSSTANTFYSILDMANIHYKNFNYDMSVFSEKFNEKPRLVYNLRTNKIFDFDKIYGNL